MIPMGLFHSTLHLMHKVIIFAPRFVRCPPADREAKSAKPFTWFCENNRSVVRQQADRHGLQNLLPGFAKTIGRMAEWLGTGLQNLLHRFESGSDLNSI